jgi:Zinc knuckle
MTDCYNCGQEGHVRAECPQRWPVPAATRASPVAVEEKRFQPLPPGTPPAAEYLAAREDLGHQPGGEWLAVACPWCEVGAWQSCVNRAISRVRPPHHARIEAAEVVAAPAG